MHKGVAIGIGIAVVAIAMLAVPWNRPSDEVQIRAAIDEAINAGKEGRSGVVLDFLTSRFEINGESLINRGELSKMIGLMRPDVTLEGQNLSIAGNNAEMVADFRIRSESAQFPMDTKVTGAKLEFSREPYMRWLVFPDSKWRLNRITMDEALVPR